VQELRGPLQRAAAAAGAAAVVGITTSAMPFFPAGWPLGLAAVAAVLTALSETAGLAFCLAVPVLPLGNYALGLAVAYAIVAVAALVAFRRTPRAGLLVALGAGLGAIGAIGLLPVLALAVRWPARRALSVALAVLVAAAVASAARVTELRVPATRSPLVAARAVATELAHHPQLLATAVALALAAAALSIVRRRGPLAAAGYALAACGLTVALPPHTPNVPVLAVTAATGLVLALEPYATRRKPKPARPVEETTATVAVQQEARSTAARR
jgi:hypothetical protein